MAKKDNQKKGSLFFNKNLLEAQQEYMEEMRNKGRPVGGNVPSDTEIREDPEIVIDSERPSTQKHKGSETLQERDKTASAYKPKLEGHRYEANRSDTADRSRDLDSKQEASEWNGTFGRNVIDAQKEYDRKMRTPGVEETDQPPYDQQSYSFSPINEGVQNPDNNQKVTGVTKLETSVTPNRYRSNANTSHVYAGFQTSNGRNGEGRGMNRGYRQNGKADQAQNNSYGPTAWIMSPYSLYRSRDSGTGTTEGFGTEKLDLKKLGSPGTLPFRVTSIEKLLAKSTVRYGTDTSTYGTDARRGFEEAYDYAAITAGTAVKNAGITLAHSLEKNMAVHLKDYNKLLQDVGGSSLVNKYGCTKITGTKDLVSIRNGINAVLKREYGTTIHGSGRNGIINAARFLRMNKGKLSPQMEALIRNLYMDSLHAQTLMGRGRRFQAILRVGQRRLGRYLRQADAGYGAYLVYQIATRAIGTLQNGIHLTRSLGKSAQIAILQGAKAAAWASAKAAKHLPKTVLESQSYQTAVSTAKKTQAVSRSAIRHTKGLVERVQAFRKDPFHFHTRTRKAAAQVKNSVMKRLNRTFLKKPIKVAGKAIRIPNMIASAAARLVSTGAAVIHGVSSLLLWIITIGGGFLLFFVLIMAVVTMIAGNFNFTAHEEEIIEAAIEQIRDSYEEQNEAIEALYSQYRNVNVTYEDIKDEEVYEQNIPDSPVNETTNAAEILSMATVYFDFDLEGAGKNEVKEYVRKLYNGSHTTDIVTHVYTYTDEEGEPYTVTDADVTVRTYYFNGIFSCSLKDTFGTLSGSEVSEQVWNYFRSAGFSEEATAGIMGNLMQESGMDPTAVQNGGAGPAAGITQWENYTAGTGRWKGMSDYAASQGKEWTDLKCQLDYIIIEMPTVFQTYSGHGTYTYPNGTETWWPEAITMDEFKALDDVDLATEIYERTFTRASIPMMSDRKSYAQSYYNMYKGMEATSDTAQTIIDTAYAQLGKPYEYGATGPDSFDCSGLVRYCYAAAGISIPRTAEEQAAQGTLVYTPQPGDICCTSGHVGIYIGNNQMIEAPTEGQDVCISQVRADKFVRFE